VPGRSGYLSTANNATLALLGATFNERDSNALSAVYIQATDSLKIVGSTSSAINGNVFAVGGTVNGTRTTASIRFVGPDSTDGLIVSGNLTLGTAQVNVNLTYPAPAPAAMGQGVTPDATAPTPLPTVNQISCTNLTISHSTSVLTVNNPQQAVPFDPIAITCTGWVNGDFTYFGLGTITTKWNVGAAGSTLWLHA
jgi:hypothetical protein